MNGPCSTLSATNRTCVEDAQLLHGENQKRSLFNVHLPFVICGCASHGILRKDRAKRIRK
jgi:hypothetical protein